SERKEYRFWDHWLADGREPHIFSADVGTGRCRDLLAWSGIALQPWEPSAEHYDISPDGGELALTVDLADEPRMMNEADIVTVNLATGRHRTLTAQSGFSDEPPRYSPDGAYLAWHSYNVRRAFNDQGRLTLYTRKGASTRRLAPRLDRATTRLAWGTDSASLYMLIEYRGRQGLYRLGLKDALPSPVAAGGTIAGFALSSDGCRVVFDRARTSHPPALFCVGPDSTGERALDSPNRALLSRAAIGEAREFTVK